MGFGSGGTVSAASGQNAETVIRKVFKPVGAALDELHFPVEAFGDAGIRLLRLNSPLGKYPPEPPAPNPRSNASLRSPKKNAARPKRTDSVSEFAAEDYLTPNNRITRKNTSVLSM